MLFLDACTIIYLLEAVDTRGDKIRNLVSAYLYRTKKPLMVSSLSLLECSVLPEREKNTSLLALLATSVFLLLTRLILLKLPMKC